jgi:hypothetical protein
VAQRPVVRIECDIPATKKPHKGVAEPFEYKDPETGELRVVDLCDAHGGPARAAVAKVAVYSRPASQQVTLPTANGRSGPRARGGASNGQSTASSTQIREWAKAEGIPVKDRGRVPADLVLRYKAAH